MATIYRLYTQDLNRKNIVKLSANKFDSFTIQSITGFYHGKAEASIVIEIADGGNREVQSLAKQIKALNGQSSVLVAKLRGSAKLVKTGRRPRLNF